MQYAQIIPNTKTGFDNSIFTYKIPPELLPEIQTGSLVKIPFQNREIEGIVFKIKKRKSPKSEGKKLKTIKKIIYPESYFSEKQIRLALWVSKYYYSPLSKCVFSILPDPLLRKIQNEKIISNANEISQKDTILIKNFEKYLKLIQNTPPKKQILFLFPQIELAEIFARFCENKFPEKIALYHSGQTKKEKWLNHLKILKSEAKIVIGSQIAVFAPFSNLHLIVVDSADSENYKQDSEPRYDARRVALEQKRLMGSKIIFSTPAPPLNFISEIKRKTIFWLKPKPINPDAKIQIIDLNNEYLKHNYSLLSENAQEKLIQNFKNRASTLLFINKKGAASAVYCRDCSYTFRCPNCDTVLTHWLTKQKIGASLICHQCGFIDQKFSTCPQCKNANLAFLGGGTEKLASEVIKILPQAKILAIEKGKISVQKIEKFDVIIATSKIFSSFFQPVNTVVAVLPDLTLNLPDFRATEKVFEQLKWLELYAVENFIIQTHYPQNFVYKALNNKNDLLFYQNELDLRQKENYPPYSKLLRIYSKFSDYKTGEEKAQSLVSQFSKIDKNICVLGPSLRYNNIKDNEYAWQITLKNVDFNQILTKIPKNWKIDIDPTSIL